MQKLNTKLQQELDAFVKDVFGYRFQKPMLDLANNFRTLKQQLYVEKTLRFLVETLEDKNLAYPLLCASRVRKKLELEYRNKKADELQILIEYVYLYFKHYEILKHVSRSQLRAAIKKQMFSYEPWVCAG